LRLTAIADVQVDKIKPAQPRGLRRYDSALREVELVLGQ
jgi:hypothetical protein